MTRALLAIAVLLLVAACGPATVSWRDVDRGFGSSSSDLEELAPPSDPGPPDVEVPRWPPIDPPEGPEPEPEPPYTGPEPDPRPEEPGPPGGEPPRPPHAGPPFDPPGPPPWAPGPPPSRPGPPHNGDELECRTIDLPASAAIEQIRKCRGAPAELERRRP